MSTSKHVEPAVSLADVLTVLRRAGGRVFCVLPGADDSLPLTEAAARLGVGKDWMREHIAEFPGAWRLPAGSRKVAGGSCNVGQLRIPIRDLLALQERQRLRRSPPQ
jgi:hypothetical protein